MSSWIKWLAFLTIVFFGVGEFAGGWYLGVPPQTPVMVYKKTVSKQLTRRTLLSNEFPFAIDGSLQSGTLNVQVIYERPASFQNPGVKPVAPKLYFDKTFTADIPVHLVESMKNGPGIYTIRLVFEDATGRLSVDVPTNSEL